MTPTRKTSRFLAMEHPHAHADLPLVPVSDGARGADHLGSALIFRGMLYGAPLALVLWLLMYEVVK